ncbi:MULTISPECIES: LytR C-terminal domain-containing protein [unclassified Streptomyces]|uniref:LytR C-terminal domain-containing protein n=1 Tax=unclassified Streptomyces TaxID=2593676 RepID=UPI001F04971A|nr:MULTISPECIES: LytR C-terminal domain-containing protein [unclassified Streptomyces]MCH0566986.1 LytR C-terminal domain-containing protein [Streptomyces sp. MUM 2J]MCH0572584.1 LytR C-terminal domain-containing protein [Streptomyces sp. MUM 136J]
MGGKYRITGDKYPRMRRPRRRGRLLLMSVTGVALLGVMGWGTLQLIDVFTGGDKASAAGTKADCATRATPSPRPVALPEPDRITVNVLNATPRSGLAKQTADELRKRGFHIGEVGNATKEYDKKITGAGVLLGPASSLNSTLPVLATQLPAAERRTDAARKGEAVDLILGSGFKSLAAQPDAARALAELMNPQPAPTASRKGC